MNRLLVALQSGYRLALCVGVFFVLLLLPFEVLFQISSWELFMSYRDMAREIAMLILVVLAISVLAAFLIGTFGGGLSALLAKQASNAVARFDAIAGIVVTVMMSLMTIRSFKLWLQAITEKTIVLGAWKYLFVLSLAAVAILLVRKFGLLAIDRAIQDRVSKAAKPLLFVTILAMFVVGLSGGVSMRDNDDYVRDVNISSGKPNIILLTIDTLSAEDMSLYGYDLRTTPKLEEFSRQGYVFENFFSSSNWTTPSVASLLSGQYPSTTGVHQFGSFFSDDGRSRNLADILTDAGYSTVAIVANYHAHPYLTRIDKSFSKVTVPPIRTVAVIDPLINLARRIEGCQTGFWLEDKLRPLRGILLGSGSLWPPNLVFDRALSEMDSLGHPYFVWAHIFPPHSPYRPSPGFKYLFLPQNGHSGEGSGTDYPKEYQSVVDLARLRYDEFILDTDAAVGDFLSRLKLAGRFDDSIIIIAADHGESFSNGYFGHGGLHLFQSLIHIPLMIHLPGQAQGYRVSAPAGQVDLLPTVLSLVDLPVPAWAEGESLVSAMLEKRSTVQPKFSMNLDFDSRFQAPSKGTFAVVQDGWKFVRYLKTGEEVLYDLGVDPRETNDLSATHPELASKMRNLIYTRFGIKN